MSARLDRSESYKSLIQRLEPLLAGESDLIANLANAAAEIKDIFGFWWVGFYLVKGEELVLGPFQGPVACTRIPRGKGVCGAAWESKEVVVVPDVHHFPGHIACSAASNSEIVVPILVKGTVVAVLDIDSIEFDDFGPEDVRYFSHIARMLRPKFPLP